MWESLQTIKDFTLWSKGTRITLRTVRLNVLVFCRFARIERNRSCLDSSRLYGSSCRRCCICLQIGTAKGILRFCRYRFRKRNLLLGITGKMNWNYSIKVRHFSIFYIFRVSYIVSDLPCILQCVYSKLPLGTSIEISFHHFLRSPSLWWSILRGRNKCMTVGWTGILVC